MNIEIDETTGMTAFAIGVLTAITVIVCFCTSSCNNVDKEAIKAGLVQKKATSQQDTVWAKP